MPVPALRLLSGRSPRPRPVSARSGPLQVSSSGAAARDGRLQVGMRILEVNQQSLLGMTHTEAVQILRGVGDALLVLVCDGFDPRAAAAIEVSLRSCP